MIYFHEFFTICISGMNVEFFSVTDIDGSTDERFQAHRKNVFKSGCVRCEFPASWASPSIKIKAQRWISTKWEKRESRSPSGDDGNAKKMSMTKGEAAECYRTEKKCQFRFAYEYQPNFHLSKTVTHLCIPTLRECNWKIKFKNFLFKILIKEKIIQLYCFIQMSVLDI